MVNLLSKDTIKKNLVLITSKICTSKESFSYIKHRSIYTNEERYEQTLKTINSIRKYIPESYIILFDNTDFSINNNYYMKETIESKVDMIINIIDDDKLNYYTNNCPYKFLAELHQTKKSLEIIKKININFFNFFKITGRYCINDNFNFNLFNVRKNFFKQNKIVRYSNNYYYTCFYKIDKNYLDKFIKIIDKIITNENDFLKLKYYDLEIILPQELNYEFEVLDTLGITQNISVRKDTSDI